MRNKKGLSTVVGTLLMILLAVIAVGIVWAIVNGIIKSKTESSACFGNYGKLTLNNDYTCYDSTSGNFQFSVEVGDIDINGIVVTISSVSETKSFTIDNVEKPVEGLINYDGTMSIKIPDKNAGLTYIATNIGKPDSVKIAMIIGKNQCGVADSIEQIDDCSFLD